MRTTDENVVWRRNIRTQGLIASSIEDSWRDAINPFPALKITTAPGEWEPKLVSYSDATCANVTLGAWEPMEPRREIGQGMTRGCWNGQPAGPFPGYTFDRV